MTNSQTPLTPSQASPPSLEAIEAAITRLTAAQERRKARNKLATFEPYPKQFEFYKSGMTDRERLLMAANQVGKCRLYGDTVEHPDGSVSQIGALFDAGRPFQVKSWDGSKIVSADVSHVVQKPAEPCVEVLLESGATFTCSLEHLVLTCVGYAFVGSTLASAVCLPAYGQAFGPLVHGEDVQHSTEKALGFRLDYPTEFHCSDGQPQKAADNGQGGTQQQDDARQPRLAWSPSDDLDGKGSGIRQQYERRPSSLGGRVRSLVRSAVFLARASYMSDRHSNGSLQVFRRLLSGCASLAQSVRAGVAGQSLRAALVSPGCGANKIVAYRAIGAHPIYDMTVPVSHNYVADGIVHHNTYCGAMELAMHLTGRYPDWWPGRRFNRAISAWAGSDTGETTRDTVQTNLMGPAASREDWGTAAIPADAIAEPPRMRLGVADAIDTVLVKHISGANSTLGFKSYDQKRQKWQGTKKDVVWLDEEPPMDIYMEALTRTNAVDDGIIFLTFTPLLGMSDVVHLFMDAAAE